MDNITNSIAEQSKHKEEYIEISVNSDATL